MGLPERLSTESEYVLKSVTEYISAKRTSDEILNKICDCSLNCDRVEGTNRSLFALNEQYIDPEVLIGAFGIDDDALLIKRELLPLIEQFWRLQEFLYKKYIYTYEVLASEAMLTRALEFAFGRYDDAKAHFLMSSDEDATEEMKKDEFASEILSALNNKRYFTSLAAEIPALVEQYEPQARGVRFDPWERKELERRIGNSIGCRPEFVISHFSYRKHFSLDDAALAQHSLFDSDGFVSAERFNKSIYKRNKSGEIFDIFVAGLESKNLHQRPAVSGGG
jgi:HD superfamily phosphohydrolase